MKLFCDCKECRDTGLVKASKDVFRVWMYGEMIVRKCAGEKIFILALDMYRKWKKTGKIPCTCR